MRRGTFVWRGSHGTSALLLCHRQELFSTSLISALLCSAHCFMPHAIMSFLWSRPAFIVKGVHIRAVTRRADLLKSDHSDWFCQTAGDVCQLISEAEPSEHIWGREEAESCEDNILETPCHTKWGKLSQWNLLPTSLTHSHVTTSPGQATTQGFPNWCSCVDESYN